MTALTIKVADASAMKCAHPRCEQRIGREVGGMFRIHIGKQSALVRPGSSFSVQCCYGHWTDVQLDSPDGKS